MIFDLNDFRWQAVDPLAGLVMMIDSVFDQRTWRFRYDDGNETGATWVAGENTAIIEQPTENFRIRFEIQETAGGSANNQTIVLQYNVNGAGWNDIGTSSAVVRLFVSPHVANGTATTDQLTGGTGTFLPGVIATTASGTDISFSGNDHTEVEWCIQILAEDVNDNDTIEFRVTVNGAIPATSTAGNATLTVNKPGQGTFATPDNTDVAWSVTRESVAAFEVDDIIESGYEGEAPFIGWGELTHHTGILDTTYTDTVEPGEWYRYAVVGTDENDDPITLYTDWVQVEAVDEADLGQASGSGLGSGSVSGHAILYASAAGSGAGLGAASGIEYITLGIVTGSGVGSAAVSGISIDAGALHGTGRGFGSASGFVSMVLGSAAGSGGGSGEAQAVEAIFMGAIYGSGIGQGLAQGIHIAIGTAIGSGSGSGQGSAQEAVVMGLAAAFGIGGGQLSGIKISVPPINLMAYAISSTEIRTEWESGEDRFILRREEWAGVGDPS